MNNVMTIALDDLKQLEIPLITWKLTKKFGAVVNFNWPINVGMIQLNFKYDARARAATTLIFVSASYMWIEEKINFFENQKYITPIVLVLHLS